MYNGSGSTYNTKEILRWPGLSAALRENGIETRVSLFETDYQFV